MRAMLVKKGWFSSGFELGQIQAPQIKDDEVLVSVYAAGVHKDDLQESDNGVCPGFECSGTITAVGRNVQNWKVDDRVCALLEGGGYAEHVAVPANLLLPVPKGMSLEDAASLPYATCTIWLALFKRQERVMIGKEKILIHEGASKISLLAIKFAKYMGMQVIVTTGSDGDFPICVEYGADECINHKTGDFVAFVKARTGRRGVNFVLDYEGSNLQKNFDCCALGGRVLIAKLHGLEHEPMCFASVVAKHLQVKVIELRSQSLDCKASIVAEVQKSLWPAVEKLKVPAIHQFSMLEASRAHKLLKKTEHEGRIILYNGFKKHEVVDELGELSCYCHQKLE